MIEPLKSKDNKANNLTADTGINYVGRDEICKTAAILILALIEFEELFFGN